MTSLNSLISKSIKKVNFKMIWGKGLFSWQMAMRVLQCQFHHLPSIFKCLSCGKCWCQPSAHQHWCALTSWGKEGSQRLLGSCRPSTAVPGPSAPEESCAVHRYLPSNTAKILFSITFMSQTQRVSSIRSLTYMINFRFDSLGQQTLSMKD